MSSTITPTIYSSLITPPLYTPTNAVNKCDRSCIIDAETSVPIENCDSTLPYCVANSPNNFTICDMDYLDNIDNYQNASIEDKLYYSEANLMKYFNIFNDEYFSYVNQCIIDNSGQQISSSFVPPNDNPNNFTCGDLKSIINNDNITLNTYVEEVTNDILPELLDTTVTDASYNYIKDQHDIILKKRMELDVKLRELYDIKGSRGLEYNSNFDSTIYTGVLLTVITSVIIYYTFIKI